MWFALPLLLWHSPQSDSLISTPIDRPEIRRRVDRLKRILVANGQTIPPLTEKALRKAFVYVEDRRVHQDLVALAADDEYGSHVYEAVRLMPDRVRGAWALRLVPDPRPNVRRVAAQLLITSSVPAARELASLSTDGDPDIRSRVAFALGWRDGDASTRVLGRLARDPSPEVRASAFHALGMRLRRGEPGVLTRGLEDPDPNVRFAALRLLQLVYDDRLDKALVHPKLKDPHAPIRLMAMRFLQQLYKIEGRRAAALLLDDPDGAVRKDARRILGLSP